MARKRVCTTISLKPVGGGCVRLRIQISCGRHGPPLQESPPLAHLFRERALRAIGIVLHAKIFVDLEQALLVCDGFQNCFRRGSFPKRRVAAVSSRLFDNCAGNFAYSDQRCVLGGVEASASCAAQNGNSTFARISATRESPISAIFFGDASEVSV